MDRVVEHLLLTSGGNERVTFHSTPGKPGLVAISVGVLAVSALITLVTGSLLHWFPVALGLVVGMMAVRSINS